MLLPDIFSELGQIALATSSCSSFQGCCCSVGSCSFLFLKSRNCFSIQCHHHKARLAKYSATWRNNNNNKSWSLQSHTRSVAVDLIDNEHKGNKREGVCRSLGQESNDICQTHEEGEAFAQLQPLLLLSKKRLKSGRSLRFRSAMRYLRSAPERWKSSNNRKKRNKAKQQ